MVQKINKSKVSVYFACNECSLGFLLAAKTETGICAIFAGDDPEQLVSHLKKDFPTAVLIENKKDSKAFMSSIINLIENPQNELNIDLDIYGSKFQQQVWREIRKIPTGSTLSYRELAINIGRPKAFRAVARACATNNIAIAIPCHRVISSNGSLSGYRWGIERKRTLLLHEHAII